MDPFENVENEDEKDEESTLSEEEKQKKEAVKKEALEKLQAEATEKQIRRTELMGELLRSKGFFWMATSNDVIGGWQQAGNVLRIEPENPWMCLLPENERKELLNEDLVMEDMKNEAGELYEYKDRRQEIVFI